MFKKMVTALLVAAMITTSAVAVSADSYRPSAQQSGAPEVSYYPDYNYDNSTDDTTNDTTNHKKPSKPSKDSHKKDEAKEEGYVAVIRDENGKIVKKVSKGGLIVTPLSEADKAPKEIKDMLESAFQQIKNVNNLGDLTASLEATIKNLPGNYKVENLVVGDLFDVSVSKEYKEALKKNGSIEITFQLSKDSADLVAVLHNIEGTKWETIPENRIVRNGDKVTVTFTSLSPVAFVYEDAKLEARPGKKSPETGEANYAGLVAAGLMAVGAVTIATKKSK